MSLRNNTANGGSSPAPCSVSWINATTDLPDEEMTVLIALNDGEVWTGFREDGEWRYVSADPVEQGEGTFVTHWADFPSPPNRQVELDPRDRVYLKDTSGGQIREIACVTEIGLYELIFRSRTEAAKRFRRWVCEVIREIRLKGYYIHPGLSYRNLSTS